MEMQDIVRRYYNSAVKMQNIVENNFDCNMREIICGNQPFDEEIVKSWLRHYGSIRGISAAKLDVIIQTIQSCLGRFVENRELNREEFVMRNITLLLGELYMQSGRDCLVIASKILWCKFPNDFVIYDKFLSNTVTVFQKIFPELSNIEILGDRPKIRDGNINATVEYYMRYQGIFHLIYTNMVPILLELRELNQVHYPYDIRILDKILWIVGNPDKDMNVLPIII